MRFLALFVAVVILALLVLPTVPRPVFQPFAGISRLRMPSTAMRRNNIISDKMLFSNGQDVISLSYYAEPIESNVVFLDEELAVDRVSCDADRLILAFGDVSAAAKSMLHKKLSPGTVITGGPEWGCSSSHHNYGSILYKVEDARRTTEGFIELKTSPATFTDVFKTLRVSFKTTQLGEPKRFVPSEREMAKAANRKNRFALGGWGDFFSNIWHDISEVGHVVENVVKDVVTVVNVLSGGSYVYNGTFFHYSKSWTPQSFALSPQGELNCSSCSANLYFGINFELDIDDLQLQQLVLVAEGNVNYNIQGTLSLSDSYSNSGTFQVASLEWGPITFTVGPVPFVIFLKLPIHVVWSLSATASAQFIATASAAGYIRYGTQYQNGQLTPVNEHSYYESGDLDNIAIDVQVDAQVGLLLVPVVNIDYVGNVNFGVKPYIEASLDYSNETGCNGTIRAVLNWGIEVTVGANISIGVFSHVWGPDGLVHLKKPITSGCLQLLAGSDSYESPLMIGNTWHGWQEPGCQNSSYPPGNVTFQFIAYDEQYNFYFVTSFNLIMPDSTWCIVQTLYQASYDDSGDVVMKPHYYNAYNDVGYQLCQNQNYTLQASPIYGTISNNNWDVITVQTADGCATLQMYRQIGYY